MNENKYTSNYMNNKIVSPNNPKGESLNEQMIAELNKLSDNWRIKKKSNENKRFYLMNVEDPLHEYGRWCKPVLEDGETGKQYEQALQLMDLLNDLSDENNHLQKNIKEIKKENNIINKKMNRLYNYFQDYLSDELGSNQFSEMWDFVAEDTSWD